MTIQITQKLQGYAMATQLKNELILQVAEHTGGIANDNAKSRNQMCPDCGGMGFFRPDVPVGHSDFGKPIRCANPVHVAREVNLLSGLSTMRPHDINLRLSDIKTIDGSKEMLDACKRLLKQPYGWLYIWGNTGNAKSIALKAMCNHLALKGYNPVVYIKFTRLMDIIRDAFNEKDSRQKYMEAGVDPATWANLGYLDRFEQLKRIKVLAVDEFDKEHITPFVEKFRFDFLDERYEQAWRGESITLFAGNTPPDELPAALESRVTDGRFMAIENTAGDGRQELTRPENIIVHPMKWLK
ncbi:MAG: hypothetical protein ACREIQ_00640 [Nitrospiria bacterium]